MKSEKSSFIQKIKQKVFPYLLGATVGLLGNCTGDSTSEITPTPPVTTGPVTTNTQGEADIQDVSDNAYHIIVRDEKTLELLSNIDVYTINHSIEIPVIDKLNSHIAELKILSAEPQTLEVLLSKLTDRVSDGLPSYKMWFHPEPINWTNGTTKIGTNIPMSQLADFYEANESSAVINLLEVLPNLWGIDTSALIKTREQILENCSLISMILGLNPDDIHYDIYRENITGMLYHIRVDGIGVSNTRPVVEIPYLRGTFCGDVQVPYTLKDAEGDLCNIIVEFSKDGINFLPATQGAGGDGLTNLSTSLAGVNHIFVWDSRANNVGLSLEERVQLKVRPFDAGGEGHKDMKTISVGGKIAFSSDRDGNDEIYKMNADGSLQERLTNNTAYDSWPSWSPDGSKIAFESNRDGNGEIYVMNSDGSNVQRLTNNTAVDWYPSWSPDGSKIAFVSYRNGNYEIYVMNSDGSGQTNLTNHPNHDESPSWSPDGSKIAFESNRDANQEIYVINTDGSGQTRLTNNGDHDKHPSWSPDGTKIAFSSDRDGTTLNYEIYTINPDGSGLIRLTDAIGWDEYPSWSPDGSKITFSSGRDGNSEIYIMNADGTDPINLTKNGSLNTRPVWY